MRALLGLTLLLLAHTATAKITTVGCLRSSGGASDKCLLQYTKALAACTQTDPTSCHPATGKGPLDPALDAIEAPVRRACDDTTAFALGYIGLDDAVLRTHDACADFGDALFDIAGSDAPAHPSAKCQRAVDVELAKLRDKTIALFGRACFLREATGAKCHRPARDRHAAALQKASTARITKRCGADVGTSGFPAPADLVATTFDRARHFAIFVYPPNDLGPTADFGPFPVGVSTLELADPSRPSLDPNHPGPRPVTTEIWYPSTAAAVAGKDRYVVNLFGFDVAKTPTYRDVAIAPGPFPLVLFSHGNGGIRFQSIFLAAHLASHGYVVASPDHHGNTFLDLAQGIVDPIASDAVNRPLDMMFLLDQLLAMNGMSGNFFDGAMDASEIGMSGHSFGGYTTFALAAGATADPRMRAFLPLAPAAIFDASHFAAITAPILIMGGTLDVTTPFPANQLAPYQSLPHGAKVVGLGEITGAGHFTFSDICEVPRNLVGAIGGFDEACTPAHLPWHDAHDIINYVALNFFDATLRGDTDALARLDPATLASFDDLDYQAK
jgi:predicted dienelactone hydrolase